MHIKKNIYFFEKTVREVNDFREACLYGLRLKTWDPKKIASFGIPNGVKFEAGVWSVSAITLSFLSIIFQFPFGTLNSDKGNNYSEIICSRFKELFKSLNDHPLLYILLLITSESFEIIVQFLYLMQISSGDNLQLPFAIRTQLYLVFLNTVLVCISFSWSVTKF